MTQETEQEPSNVIQARFTQPTSLEEYLECIDEIQPDDILSLVIKDNEVSILGTLISKENLGKFSIHLPALSDFIFDLYYNESDEEDE